MSPCCLHSFSADHSASLLLLLFRHMMDLSVDLKILKNYIHPFKNFSVMNVIIPIRFCTNLSSINNPAISLKTSVDLVLSTMTSTQRVLFRRLSPAGHMPTRATRGSVGYDLYRQVPYFCKWLHRFLKTFVDRQFTHFFILFL